MKRCLCIVLFCAFWSDSLWSSAREEIIFTDAQKTMMAHLARFEEGALLNDYVDSMTTFWRPDNFPEDGYGGRDGYCVATYGVYALLLKGLVHAPETFSSFAKEVIDRVEEERHDSFKNALETEAAMSWDNLRGVACTHRNTLEGLRTQSTFPLKMALFISTQLDLVELIREYKGMQGAQRLRALLVTALFEQVYLCAHITQVLTDHLQVPQGLEGALKTFTPRWEEIIVQMQDEAPCIHDPNVQSQELVRSLRMLEKAQRDVEMLSDGMQENQDIIAQAHRYITLVNPTITLQDPLARLYAIQGQAYVYPATSAFLTALQMYFSNAESVCFAQKFNEIGPIYRDNTVDNCLGDWFENGVGTHVKGILPIYEEWRRNVGAMEHFEWDESAYMLTLKYYLSWWSACTFAQSQGEGALLPREAFALVYSAWREVDLAVPEDFELTLEDKQNLVRFPVMQDLWNAPASLAKGDGSA